MFGKLIDVAVNTVTSPLETAADALDILGGLTIGEIRIEAVKRIGYRAAWDMTQAELIVWYKDK